MSANGKVVINLATGLEDPERVTVAFLVGGAAAHFDMEGNLTDPELRASLVELVEALRTWTLRIDTRRAAA
jgi:hypothetical protein